MSFDTPPSAPVFPGADLDVRAELLVNGAWTNISTRVAENTSTIIRGHPDESTTAAPSSISSTLDNSDGALSNFNPNSPYYGQLNLNTNIRWSIPDGSSHLRIENDSVSGYTTPAATAFNSLTNLDLWFDGSADNWYAPQILMAKWASASNQRSWMFYTWGDGTIELAVSHDGAFGANAFQASSGQNGKLPKTHGRLSVRVTYNSATGAVNFYTGTYCTGWTLLSSVTASAFTPFASTTSALEIGYAASSTDGQGQSSVVNAFNGKIYAAAVIPTIGGAIGTAVAAPDFTALTPGTTTFTDAASVPWSPEGTSTIDNRYYRFHGEAAAWPQKWAPPGNEATISLAAGGLLRRMGSSNTTVNSAMKRACIRQTGLYAPIAYWSFEDGQNSTQLASGIGGQPFRWSGNPTLASNSAFACSSALPVLNSAILSSAVLPAYTSTSFAYNTGGGGDAVVRFLLNIPSGGDTNGGVICRVLYANGTGSAPARVDLVYGTGGSITLIGYNSGGGTLWTLGPFAFNLNGALVRGSIEMVSNGSGGYTPNFVSVAPGQNFGQTTTGTLTSGVVGNVKQVIFNPGKDVPLLTGSAVGHVMVQSTWSSLFVLGSALAAYTGEFAGIRFQRLCGEEGIQFRGIGNLQDTVAMGPQTQETVAQLLQECADADRGMWFEPRQCLGWGYRTRASIGNQPAGLAFDYTQNHLSDDLLPTDDDQTVKNDITVTNQQDGSSSRQVLSDGSPKATNTIGRYDTQLTINLASDAILDNEAYWILHALTVNEPRYVAINADMNNTALASLWYTILEMEIGDRLTVANLPSWLPPNGLDQIFQGVTETLSRAAFKESWNGIPTTPWNTAYEGDAVYGRADTDGSQLTSGVTSGATSLVVQPVSAGLMPWSPKPYDAPFDIGIGGERITVSQVSGSLLTTGINTGTFESGTGNWSPAGNCAIAQTTAQAHSGTHSLSVTSTAAGTMACSHCTAGGITTTGLACSPGDTVVAGAWFMPAATPQKVQIQIGFYTSAGVLINTVLTTGANYWQEALGQWVEGWQSQIAPATTAFARAIYSWQATSAASEVHYIDDAWIMDLTAVMAGTQTMTVTRSVNGVVKPQAAGADVRLWYPPIASL